jgi:hypothetical protein
MAACSSSAIGSKLCLIFLSPRYVGKSEMLRRLTIAHSKDGSPNELKRVKLPGPKAA